MSDCDKLVEALRERARREDEYYEHGGDVINDAAAAIEALQAALQAEKKKTVAQIYYEEQMAWEGRCKDLMYWIADLQAQLPKREEVWKDVIGYEGLYQVSNQARVRNSKGQILKQCVKVGKCVYYKYVQLYKDGRYKMKYVHRIMAECFLPNPDNLPIINHKDEDGTNNRLDNLEWCTVEYNSNYGNAKRNMSRGKRRRAKMEVQDGQ